MALRQLIRLFFPALMAVGLVLSPFSASVAESATGCEAMVAMADDMRPGDMQNCPSKQPVAPDCQKTCPLMMTCAVNWVASMPPAGGLLALEPGESTVRPGNDTVGGPLAEGPPARPPRT